MKKRALNEPEAIKNFVFQSELLSAMEPNLGSEETKRHLDLAMTLLRSPHRYVPVELINGALLRTSEDWFRKGTDGALQGLVPPGKRIEGIIKTFNDGIIEVVEGGCVDDSADSRERYAVYAWERHDYLICLHAFRGANGRTARLHLNHVRALLGLPLYIIEFENTKYFENLEIYREQKFIPQVVKAAA